MKISLDGTWWFKADSGRMGKEQRWFADTADHSKWTGVSVPDFWEKYPGLGTYDGWGWFRREFTIEKTAEPMSIHFAGVDDDAVVWVNGVEVGNHSGYSDPFAVDVSAGLRNGRNSLVVLVMDHGGGGGIYQPVTLIDTRNIEELLKSPYFGRPALKSADWVKDATIYSVYLRSFSKEGNFAGLEKRVPELKKMGVTVLWLLPIHPVGVKKRKGTLGSPYAVQDYYGINPEFGTMQDFKRLLNTVRKNGLKLIIDLVVNHTSWDSKLINEHPEWFTKDAHGNMVSPNDDWTDVADLDYSNPGLRKYIIEMMRYWVKDIGVDGFRCDVAELVPTDFWEDARAQLSRIKPVMMLSEGSLPEHHMKAFDMTYAWSVYNALNLIINGGKSVTILDDILKNEHLQFPTGSLRMRFNTNHDKNASDTPAVKKFGEEGLKAATVLIATMPGVPLMYTGEEVANDRVLSLFEKVGVDWTRPRDMQQLYTTLFNLRRDHKALSRGEMIRVPARHEKDVYAFFRVAGNDKVLVVINFSAEARFTTLDIPMGRVFPRQPSVVLHDVFTDYNPEITVDTGSQLVLAMEAMSFHVFVAERR